MAAELPVASSVLHADPKGHGRTVLVAVDGSPATASVLRYVTTKYWREGDELNLVQVYDVPSHVVDLGDDLVLGAVSLVELDEKLGRELELAAAKNLQRCGAEVAAATGKAPRLLLLRGVAKHQLCDLVEHQPPDVLIMGSHGHGAARTLLGSTVDFCSHQANCSVLVVKDRVYGHALDSLTGQ